MVVRARALLVSAALVAAFGSSVAANAQTVTAPDSATTAAVAQWHAGALAHIDPYFRAALAAEYADQPVSAGTANSLATPKALAEQAAMADLDSTSRALIERYYAQVETDVFAALPNSREANDS